MVFVALMSPFAVEEELQINVSGVAIDVSAVLS